MALKPFESGSDTISVALEKVHVGWRAKDGLQEARLGSGSQTADYSRGQADPDDGQTRKEQVGGWVSRIHKEALQDWRRVWIDKVMGKSQWQAGSLKNFSTTCESLWFTV